jgi:predicted peroxiredoxin
MEKKYMVVVTHSTDNHDRANGALALIVSLVSFGADVAVFLNFEGVLLAKKGIAETIAGRNFTPGRELFPMLVEAEVPLYVCSASAAANGVTEGDLVPGAKIASLPTLAFEMESRETITF